MRRTMHRSTPIVGKLFCRGRNAQELNNEIEREGYVIIEEGAQSAHIAAKLHRSDRIRNPRTHKHPKGKPYIVALYSHRVRYYRITGFTHFIDGRFHDLKLSHYQRKRLHDDGFLLYELMDDRARRYMYRQ